MVDRRHARNRPFGQVRSRSRSPTRRDDVSHDRNRGYDDHRDQSSYARRDVDICGGRDDRRDGYGNRGYGDRRSDYEPRQEGGAFRDRRDDRGGGGWGYQHRDGRANGQGRGGNYNKGGYGGCGDRGGGGRRGGGRKQEDPEGHLPMPVLPDRLLVPDDAIVIKDDSTLHSTSAGKVGVHLTVTTNHYEIMSLPRSVIYSYDVTVMTARGSQEKRELTEKVLPRVWQIDSLREVTERIFKPGNGAIWDGVSIIYSIKPLELGSDPAVMGVEDERGRTWEIRIQSRKVLDMDDLLAYAKGGTRLLQHAGAVSKNVEAHRCIIFLNALLRHMPSKRFKSGTGSKSTTFFDPKNTNLRQSFNFNNQLQAWSGVYQSAAIRFGRLTVNVDIATQVFIAPGSNFVDFAASLIGNSTRPHEVQRWYQGNCHGDKTLWNKTVGSKLKKHVGFRTRHLATNSQKDQDNDMFTQYVYGFTFTGARDFKFPRRKVTICPNGEPRETVVETTVENYFQEAHNIKLDYPYLPLVEPEGKKVTLIPMELCYVHQAERYRGDLKGDETAEFLKYATSAPQYRQAKITRNIGRLAWHENPDLKAFKITVNPKPITLQARILPAPSLLYAHNQHIKPEGGRWNLRSVAFTKPGAIPSWCLLWFPRPGRGRSAEPPHAIETFKNELPRTLQRHGFNVGQCAHLEARNIQCDKTLAIKEIGATAAKRTGIWPTMLVVVLPSEDAGMYGDIKRACEVNLGVPCQCISQAKLEQQKSLAQYLSNVALKICAKLGGISNRVYEPFFEMNRCMVYGADVSRGKGVNYEPVTYTALVGSYDPNCQQYSAVTGCQRDEDGIIEGFPGMVKELTGRYMGKHAGKMPDRILYFRSGLSEDRYEEVLDKELDALQRYNKQAKITVVICIKRHHTRLFPSPGSQHTDRLGNVLPGTVVENRPDGKDIFMVPHAGLQGTVRPTHYISVYDDNNLLADDFQRICNNLSYGYARSTMSVSMIPAVYYAGVASARAGYHTEAKEEVTEMKVGTGSNVASPGGKTPTMMEGKRMQTGVKQVINKYRMWFQ